MVARAEVEFDRSSPLLLKPDEAAETLRIGRTSLFKLIKQGDILTVKLGKSTRIRRVDLDAFVARKLAEARQ